MAITRPGATLPQINKKGPNDPGYEEDESDEYEVGDDEDEEMESDSDDDSGDEVKGGGSLTAMLLADPIGNDEGDRGWVPAGGREPADYSGDEDDQEEPAVPAWTASGATSPDDKKRARAGMTLPQINKKGPNDPGYEDDESDEYEVREDEDGEMDSNSDEDSEEEGEEGGDGLTAMLLGEVSADGVDEEDEGWTLAVSDSKKRKRENDTADCKKAKFPTASTV